MFSKIRGNNQTVLFRGNRFSDWPNITARGPIDSLSLSLKDSPGEMIEFIKKYHGKFIAGFISYEFGARQIGAPVLRLTGAIPAVHFRAYNHFELLANSELSNSSPSEPFNPIIQKEEYDKNFNKIQSYIKAGDFYQINYTHPLKSKTNLPARDIFHFFRSKNKVGYTAFIEDDGWAIHSFSPEQFIKIKNGVVSTQPIKGTMPRGITPDSDEKNLKELLHSEKEQAELYMIVDLLRNDLGKICTAGSVQVVKSKSIQKLEKVFHTYSVVQGHIKQDIHPIEALLSMSPGGSISGCPKKRVCEIIHELEDYSRGVYTGTIGCILPDGTLQFNIAIRTVVQEGNELTLGVGGGITIDSNNNDEYNESLAKAASFQP